MSTPEQNKVKLAEELVCLKELSRGELKVPNDLNTSLQYIQLSAILRIADSFESSMKDIEKTKFDNYILKKELMEKEQMIQNLRRSNNAHKIVNVKLKKTIEELKSSHT